mmetsp:Transcript_25338/g.65454  ORF Transcript_25338/g.65454 Transcript_25338/m.65454 type:complete len:224 (+) Transcript_25338:321-992(+)
MITSASASSPRSSSEAIATRAHTCASAARTSAIEPHTNGVCPLSETVMPIMRKSTGDCAASRRSIARPTNPRSRTPSPSALIASPPTIAMCSGSARAHAYRASLALPVAGFDVGFGVDLGLPPSPVEYATPISTGITISKYPLLARSMSAPMPIPVGANSLIKTNAERPGANDELRNARVLRAAAASRVLPGTIAREAMLPPTSCTTIWTALSRGKPKLSSDT